MAEKVTCECEKCGNKTEQDETEKSGPECCGKPMQLEGLDACDMTMTAEHSRMDKLDEPCDDGRAGS